MCMCCGIIETLALCAGLKVLAVCRKKKCDCPRPYTDSDKIQVINLNEPEKQVVCAYTEPLKTSRKK